MSEPVPDKVNRHWRTHETADTSAYNGRQRLFCGACGALCEKNLKEAFELYRGVMNAYPESQEARCSQEQIENIVAAIAKQVLFDAQVNMALARVNQVV